MTRGESTPDPGAERMTYAEVVANLPARTDGRAEALREFEGLMRESTGAWRRLHVAPNGGGAILTVEDAALAAVRADSALLTWAEARLAREAELVEALRPFAAFACDLGPGETCDCHNCAARAALRKAGAP